MRDNLVKPSWRTYENGIIVMLFLTFGFLFLDRLAITFLFPFIKEDIPLNGTQIGLLVSGLGVTWAVSGYIFASLSDIIGSRKKFLIPATIGFSIFSVMSGIAKNFGTLLLARGLMGASEGPVLPLAQATAAEESTPTRRGLNMGFLQSSSQLIGATIGPIVVTAVAVQYSWRAAFYIVALPGLIMAALLWRFMKDRSQPTRKNIKRSNQLSLHEYMSVFKTRNVLLCVAISICLMTWLFAYSTFAPNYFVETGYSASEMSLIMAGIGFGSFVWMIVIPALSDRLGRRLTFIIFAFIAVLSPMVFAIFHLPLWLAVLVAIILTTGNGLFPLFMVIIPSEAISIAVITTSIAVVQLVGEIVGGTIMPTVAGIASDEFGLSAPLWIAAVGALLAAIIGFGLVETAPRRVAESSDYSGLDESHRPSTIRDI